MNDTLPEALQGRTTPHSAAEAAAPVLRVRSLTVGTDRRLPVPLVHDVSFDLFPGEVLGVVGESGSGKSMTALSVLGLLPKGISRWAGEVLLEGEDLASVSPERMRHVRGQEIALISQDPGQALNPVHRIGRQISEPLKIHQRLPRATRRSLAEDALARVGIKDAQRRSASYPFEFSGGMRQRAMIAMALACKPKVLIADEPTTGLDVTVQMQVLDLIRTLATEMNMSTLLVSHDLNLVAGICDRVQVMYAGRIVESGPTADVLNRPLHPYTKALVRAVPTTSTPPGSALFALPGSPPEPAAKSTGCPLFGRCIYRHELCRDQEPPLATLAPGHDAACWVSQAGRELVER